MPVVTTAESRRQFSRRRDVGVAIENVADLVRIFPADTGERQIGESLRRFRVETRRWLFRRRRDRKQNQNCSREVFHFGVRHSSASVRNFIDLRAGLLQKQLRCFPKVFAGLSPSSLRRSSWRPRSCEANRRTPEKILERADRCRCRALSYPNASPIFKKS